MIQTFKVLTGMGHCTKSIPWLSEDEMNEFNLIGYSGKNSNGIHMSRVAYLNSLNKGNFHIEVVSSNSSEFTETLLIIREYNEIPDNIAVYLSDYMYIPIHYKGMVVNEPFYGGAGNHSVLSLEKICEQYKEYCHQQAIIKQNCMKHLVELKFNVKL